MRNLLTLLSPDELDDVTVGLTPLWDVTDDNIEETSLDGEYFTFEDDYECDYGSSYDYYDAYENDTYGFDPYEYDLGLEGFGYEIFDDYWSGDDVELDDWCELRDERCIAPDDEVDDEYSGWEREYEDYLIEYSDMPPFKLLSDALAVPNLFLVEQTKHQAEKAKVSARRATKFKRSNRRSDPRFNREQFRSGRSASRLNTCLLEARYEEREELDELDADLMDMWWGDELG